MMDAFYIPPKPAIIHPRATEIARADEPRVVVPAMLMGGLGVKTLGDQRRHAAGSGVYTANLQLKLDASLYISGTTWADGSGNGFDYTFGDGTNNKPSFTSNGVASYMGFNGSQWFTQSAAFSGSIMRKIGRNDTSFTIEAWLYWVTGSTQILWDNGDNGGATKYMQFRADNGSNAKATTMTYPLGGNNSETTSFSTATWYQIGVRGKCDGSTITFYRNGASDGTYTANNSGFSSGDSTSTPKLGTSPGNTALALASGAKLGAFYMYDADIGAAGVAQNYAAFQARSYV